MLLHFLNMFQTYFCFILIYTQNKFVCENLFYQFIDFEYNGDRII